ncbi:MAG: hypothetical protein J0I06_08720 [Planctomycetes bacterium]|nr:hypothetical protein [Planctomycetota bacterium]
MTTVLRFLVLQVLLLWQGGFLFYTAVVVPTGTKLLGAAGQGVITARVTDALNAIGAVALGALALELRLTRDPNSRRTVYRWWAWGVALACHGLLIYFHMLLDAFMDDERRRVLVAAPFYPVHRMYLWASTVQWVACALLAWWTQRAWKAEDGGFAAENAERDKSGKKN